MSYRQDKTRRPVRLTPRGESLEDRSLMTGGAGSLFAMVPATIATAGGSASHTFTINPDQFTLPRHSIVLGIDAAANGSSVKPDIVSVNRSATSSRTGQLPISHSTTGVAVTVPIRMSGSGTTAQTFTTTVKGANGTQGHALLGYYLPGDANGDGLVSDADLTAIAKAMGTTSSSTNYNFDADSNRDGKIDRKDLGIALQNYGVRVTVQPTVTAVLDPASDSGLQDRITVYQNVIFEGTGTPGATMTYAETSGKTPTLSTTIKADGTYSLVIPLAEGDNTFHVSSVDSFGQPISGNIKAVTYTKPAVPVVSPTTPTSPPTALYDPSVAVNAKTDQAAKLRAQRAALLGSKKA